MNTTTASPHSADTDERAQAFENRHPNSGAPASSPPVTGSKATLSQPTRLLFHIAARSHTLAEIFGVDQIGTERDGEEPSLQIHSVPRPWLIPHPARKNELSLSADRFAARLQGGCSDGQRHMILFILNIWNPGYAKQQGWHFDLFKSLSTLDQGNIEAIRWWLERPIWP